MKFEICLGMFSKNPMVKEGLILAVNLLPNNFIISPSAKHLCCPAVFTAIFYR
jgi:hypothetical protein